MKEKKNLLVYAHYYIPDVASSGQIQAELCEGMTDAFNVTVITTVPSYEGHIDRKYKFNAIYDEEINGVQLIRIRVPEFDKTSKLSRIWNLLSYYLGSRKITKIMKDHPFDYIFSDSQPPLIGGVLGVYGKNKLRTKNGIHPKFVYNIQDYNPEQLDVVGYFNNQVVLKLMMAIDKHNCQKSDLIIVPGRDLVETMHRRFCNKKVPETIVINNWGNDKVIYPLPSNHKDVLAFKKRYGLDNKFVFMYSGNIGLYYDLENILKVIEKFKDAKTPDGRDVVFTFVGSGSVLDKLICYKNEHDLKNIIFIPYQNKDKLIYSLNAADVHWCVNAKGIKGVSCPSKYYGIIAVEKPILGVLEQGTEMQMLINETKGGLVCEPADYIGIERNIKWFIEHALDKELKEMGRRGYDNFISNLSMNICIEKFVNSIANL